MRSIRWKIMLTTFLVVYIPIYLLNRYTVKTFDRFTSKALEEEMISHARILAEQYRMTVADTPGRRPAMTHEYAALVRRCGEKLETHLAILSPDGRVLVDSMDPHAAGRDLSDLPEVALAMQGRYRARWTLDDDRRQVVYYAALPITSQTDERLVGIAYVSQHTGQIFKAIMKIKRDQRVAMILALVGALLLSAVVALTLTRPLRKLTRAARAYAQDGTPPDLTITGHDEIAELGHAITSMSAEIGKRNAYNREFITTTTHELRTPLTAIKGAAQVLRDKAAPTEEAHDKFLSNILFETERMTRMVGELHELTKLDTEGAEQPRETVDYTAFLREIVARLEPALDKTHAPITIETPEDTTRVRLIPSHMEQVLANLLANAARYTPPEGQITISVTIGSDNMVRTTVSDSGAGIARSNIDKVFDRFFTTEPKDQNKPYGSGLGLAIAKTIVENHRGQIDVKSEPGDGTQFSFTLPRVD